MKQVYYAVIVAIFLIVPSGVHGSPIVRGGDTVSVDTSQILTEDFYAFGETVVLSGRGEHDAYIAGGTITINGDVKEDVSILGGVVQIHGKIGDDLRIVGGEVTLADTVAGDVVVLGGSLSILSSAKVEGSILFLGGELLVDGPVSGMIQGSAETVRIDAPVGGTIDLTAHKTIILGDKAEVVGDVYYKSNGELVRAQKASVTGEIHREKDVVQVQNFSQIILIEVLILIFATLALFLLARKQITAVSDIGIRETGLSGLIGLCIFVTVPLVSMLLLVSIIGSLFALILLGIYGTVLLIAAPLMVVLFGRWTQRVLLKHATMSFSTVLIGALVVLVLLLIPAFIGGFIIFGGILIMMGALSLALYRGIRL